MGQNTGHRHHRPLAWHTHTIYGTQSMAHHLRRATTWRHTTDEAGERHNAALLRVATEVITGLVAKASSRDARHADHEGERVLHEAHWGALDLYEENTEASKIES